MVKQFLSQKGVGYKEKDVSANRAYAQELVNNTGQMGVPVTVHDKDIVVGFDRQGLEQMIAKMKTASRVSFGASIADAAAITSSKGMPVKSGAYVGQVKPGSAAQRIGLASGDIITKIDATEISNAAQMQQELAKLEAGARISVVFLRGDTLKKGETSV